MFEPFLGNGRTYNMRKLFAPILLVLFKYLSRKSLSCAICKKGLGLFLWRTKRHSHSSIFFKNRDETRSGRFNAKYNLKNNNKNILMCIFKYQRFQFFVFSNNLSTLHVPQRECFSRYIS